MPNLFEHYRAGVSNTGSKIGKIGENHGGDLRKMLNFEVGVVLSAAIAAPGYSAL